MKVCCVFSLKSPHRAIEVLLYLHTPGTEVCPQQRSVTTSMSTHISAEPCWHMTSDHGSKGVRAIEVLLYLHTPGTKVCPQQRSVTTSMSTHISAEPCWHMTSDHNDIILTDVGSKSLWYYICLFLAVNSMHT